MKHWIQDIIDKINNINKDHRCSERLCHKKINDYKCSHIWFIEDLKKLNNKIEKLDKIS